MPEIEDVFYRKVADKRKLESIVNGIMLCLGPIKGDQHLDEKLLKSLLKVDDTYRKINEVPIFRRTGHKVDIYNPKKKIAIEMEKTEVKNIWKIFCKFSIAARMGLVDYAVLIVPVRYRGRGKMKKSSNIFSESKRASKFVSDILWNKNLAIIGYKKH